MIIQTTRKLTILRVTTYVRSHHNDCCKQQLPLIEANDPKEVLELPGVAISQD